MARPTFGTAPIRTATNAERGHAACNARVSTPLPATDHTSGGSPRSSARATAARPATNGGQSNPNGSRHAPLTAQ